MEQEIKFEKALERLEQIVEELEGGDIPLEEALKRYEEGVKLSRVLNQKLTQAETKIEVLTKALNGQGEDLTEGNAEPKKPERKKSKKSSSDDESESGGLLL